MRKGLLIVVLVLVCGSFAIAHGPHKPQCRLWQERSPLNVTCLTDGPSG